MIDAVQHVGIGVGDVVKSYDFYRRVLGFNFKLSDLDEYSHEMEPILGELAQLRIIMALNTRGGGAIELVQHRSSPPRPLPPNTRWGDLGVLESGYRVDNLEAIMSRWQNQNIDFATQSFDMPTLEGKSWQCVYLKDPDGLWLELIDFDPGTKCKPKVYGLNHVAIGVRDIEASLPFYRDLLGYDEMLVDASGRFPELDSLTQGPMELRMVMLRQSQGSTSVFSLLDGGMIKLVQPLDYQGSDFYQGRRWGDIGHMECCFEVSDVAATVADLQAKGVTIFHPPTYMDMGSGSRGTFAYIKDPDGNLLELVQVDRVAWLPPRIIDKVLVWLNPVLNFILR